MKLSGNTVFITGGGAGIGRALAEALHKLGNQIIISDRAAAALDEVTKANPGMQSMVLDVSDGEAIARVSAQLIAKYPKLNVVINNAGIQRIDDVGGRVDDEVLLSTMFINLLGPIRLNSALVDHLRQQPTATIINLSSMLGYVPLAEAALYCAAKAALHSYTLSLRYKLEGSSVSVLEIAPPYVQTHLLPQNMVDPRAMPLSQFIAETMEVLATEEVEVLVPRAKARRDILRPGEVLATKQFNDMFNAGDYQKYGAAAPKPSAH